jgi:signal transduction histidine kinase
LRLRIFFTIFTVLCLTAISISAIHFHFFRLERLRLIELNLLQNANILANSDLTLSQKEFSLKGQDYLQEIIGDDKINMIVGIYNNEGNLLYQNENAHIFEIPETIELDFSEWEDIEEDDYFIKYLTSYDKKQNRIIKVGMILNQSLLRWRDLNQRINVFVVIILSVITVISFFLTYLLFRPVNALARQVNLMAEKVEKGELADLQTWFPILKNKIKRNDEYYSLITSLDKLASKINENQLLTQRWSALMAHELKTPMILLKMSIDDLVKESSLPKEKVTQVELELTKLEEIIMDFLEWASVENDTNRPDLHVIFVARRTEEVTHMIARAYPHKNISFISQATSEKKIFCNPIHFDQMLNNLIINAIKHGGEEIEIIVSKEGLCIKDNGQGIHESVMENFGKPFNKFQLGHHRGHGLGLAWVNTIAKKYGWKIDINNSDGAKITITFPAYGDVNKA